MAVYAVPGYIWGDVVVLSVEDDEAGDGDAGDAGICKVMVDIWEGMGRTNILRRRWLTGKSCGFVMCEVSRLGVGVG